MGLPVSPIIANLYMESFDQKALRSASVSPKVWYRYVDDTYVVINKEKVQEFTDHINRQNLYIKFTNDPEKDGKRSLLDTLAKRQSDWSLQVTVYRKPTHTEQYIAFDSHHPLEHKLIVVRILIQRTERVVSKPEDRDSELKQVKTALKRCATKNGTLK